MYLGPELIQTETYQSDGDWHTHFLDSPEEGLLVITLFSDVESRGGATFVCEDGLAKMAQW